MGHGQIINLSLFSYALIISKQKGERQRGGERERGTTQAKYKKEALDQRKFRGRHELHSRYSQP